MTLLIFSMDPILKLNIQFVALYNNNVGAVLHNLTTGLGTEW